MPAGGTAFRSMSTRARPASVRPAASSSVTPAAPAATIRSAAAMAMARGVPPAMAPVASAGPRRPSGTTAAIRRQTSVARDNDREATVTATPLRASNRATRCPTGPVPPSTTARSVAAAAGSPSGRCLPAAATAALAVVFAPAGSSSTLTRTGPKNVFRTRANTASAAATSEPPTKIAVDTRSAPPRVNIAPCTSGTAASGVTLPCRRSTSAPASTATTASNVLGWGSQSS